MDEEIFYDIEKVVSTNHKISSYLIEFAKNEMNGRKIGKKDIINNPILNNLFQTEQKYLRVIQNKIEKQINPNYYNISIAGELKEEIEQIAMELRYIPRTKSAINLKSGEKTSIIIEPSIYQDDNYKNMRMIEYDILMQNINYIDERMRFRGDIKELTFYEKELIILDVSEKRFFEKFSIPKIEKLIVDLEQKKGDLTKERFEKIKKELIEQKYIYYYQYLNSLNNGILQKDDESFFKTINKFIEYDALQVMLELSEDEIEKNIEINLEEPKDSFNHNMKIILGPTRKNTRISEESATKTDKKIKNEDEAEK